MRGLPDALEVAVSPSLRIKARIVLLCLTAFMTACQTLEYQGQELIPANAYAPDQTGEAKRLSAAPPSGYGELVVASYGQIGTMMYTLNAVDLGAARWGLLRVPLLPGQYELLGEVRGATGGMQTAFSVRPGQRVIQEVRWDIVEGVSTRTSAGFLNDYQRKLVSENRLYQPTHLPGAYLPARERDALQQCVDTLRRADCEAAANALPDPLFHTAEFTLALKRMEDSEATAALPGSDSNTLLTLDDLRDDLQRDRLQIGLQQLLIDRDYARALPLMEHLARLPGDQPPGFQYYYGEALAATGNEQAALQALYRYISEQGPDARHYTPALTRIAELEGL